jgi:AcrR family transcriptional regulator
VSATRLPPSAARRRLLEAMARTAARDGYGNASVARVIEEAGVSRSTFYEHFANRGECFLLAYRGLAEAVLEAVRAVECANPPAKRPRAVLELLLRRAAAEPDAARLLLIEAFGGPDSVRAEHERLIARLEQCIGRFLQQADAPPWRIPPLALLGGVAGVVTGRILRDQRDSLNDLVEPLLEWAESYGGPGALAAWQGEWRDLGRRLVWTGDDTAQRAPDLLPRGRSALPSGEADAARRERIVEATIRMAASKGYAALTVNDIAAAARVSRGVFYNHFRGRDDALVATQVKGLRESSAAAASQFFSGGCWPERVWDGLAALLAYLAENPEAAFLGLVEVYAVGQEAILRDYDNRLAFTLFLEEGYRQHPAAERLPTLCSEAVAGAIYAILRRHTAAAGAAEILELLPQCAYVALAPFIGPRRAAGFVRGRVPAAR